MYNVHFLRGFIFWTCLRVFNSRQEIRTSTSSMTSVPKPLKFLRPHYGTLKAFYDTMTDLDLKVGLFVGYDFSYQLIIDFVLILFFKKIVTLLASQLQKYLADILSVLALTMSAEGERVRLLSLIFDCNMFLSFICFNIMSMEQFLCFWCLCLMCFYGHMHISYSSSVTSSYAVTLTYKSLSNFIRKAWSTGYWDQKAILVHGAMSM